MKAIEQALAALLGGRDPTAEEVAKFYRIKEVCGFSEHDAVWALLLAFGHYEILYGQIPQQIADQAHRLIAEHKIALENTAAASARHIQTNLVEQVAKTAREMAKEVLASAQELTIANSRRHFLLGASLSLGVAAIVIGLLCWMAFYLGSYSSRMDQTWSSTSQGKAARKLAEMNDVSAMLTCANGQKRVEANKTFCLPYDDNSKKVGGWRIE